MIAQRDGPFLNLARLNVEKYAREKTINRYLFDYVFLHEADMKTAQQVIPNFNINSIINLLLQIAMIALRSSVEQENDWFWPNQLGKCYYRYRY